MNNSICRKVCEYEDDQRICRGCGRTAEEITEWFYATKERKVEIAKAARKRSKATKEANEQRQMISLDLI
jgi:predicted Fe-S protein YdhL (DUF1289 family)